MSQTKPYLKYLFTAYYGDGSMYQQTQDDRSTFHPYDPETRFQPSAFRDVDHDRLIKFELVSDEGDKWSVDLIDGHFEHNGETLDIDLPPHDTPLRLIYFRLTNVNINMVSNKVKDHYIQSYNIGWQSTYQGENQQHILQINM